MAEARAAYDCAPNGTTLAPVFTLTDRLKTEVAGEIEGRRRAIDTDATLARVTIIVQIDPSTGDLITVFWRPEYQRVVRRRGRG